MSKTLQVAALEFARDLAGGVSYLARRLGLNSGTVDSMLYGEAEIPTWVFLRTVEFINEAKESGKPPPGFPEDWQEQLRGDRPLH